MTKRAQTLLLILFELISLACVDHLPERKARPEAAQQLLKLRGYEFDEKSFHAAARAHDMMAKDMDGNTALDWAIRNKRESVVKRAEAT